MIGRAERAAMRPESILLNTARGGIVDEQALADAPADATHPLAAAAVDTFEHEHAAFASPLLGLPNAPLTPHVDGDQGVPWPRRRSGARTTSRPCRQAAGTACPSSPADARRRFTAELRRTPRGPVRSSSRRARARWVC
ncbi:NAD(P)-dependent oxidoreductase [Streptomyces fagopyri]|uniref:NAD(P)-dependent oxidoreductase n=1 Tax=Streptomyces fagopyri TaxID=2662397 RepID=UPI0036C6FD6E